MLKSKLFLASCLFYGINIVDTALKPAQHRHPAQVWDIRFPHRPETKDMPVQLAPSMQQSGPARQRHARQDTKLG